jgi:predicted PurR-regulated permease PerM
VAIRNTTASWQRAFVILGSMLLVVAALYFARPVLIPVVLAMLLAFILSPLVGILQRYAVPRVPSVLLVVTLAFAMIGGVAYIVVAQVQRLALDLPAYKTEIADKLFHIREATQGSWIERINGTIRDIEDLIKQKELAKREHESATEGGPSKTGSSPDERQPIPVRPELSSLPILQSVAVSAVELLVSMVLVVVLVLFMLIKREDLRNRVLHLWGQGSLTSMTRALDDATTRISRFLLMQLLINASFGLSVAIGLTLIGVPYAFLWGFLGMCLRYIPYLGAWVAAVFPLVTSIAVLPGWTPPLLVLALFLFLELVISNFAEPWLFGRSVGVSEVALLIAAAFWAWLWGPVGLVLSTPLTACLAVMGRYVPSLEFFSILLGDEPVLEPFATYYQRILARDEDEASDLVKEYALSHDPEEVFDHLLVPALSLARRNRARGELSLEDDELILRVTREVLDEGLLPSVPHASTDEDQAPGTSYITVFGCPARDEMDELALEMLRRLLVPSRCHFEVISPESLKAEVLAKVQAEQVPVVCIGTLPPQNLAQTRYLCKRLRGKFPELKILVGCWGWEGSSERLEQRLKEAGADMVATSLLEARADILPMVQVLQHAESQKVLAHTA